MTARGEAKGPLPTEECDIVMKGGITSGVVYPAAVLALSERYRFRSIGGASVGAIAAAVTAAAEYGRQTGRGTGFAQLEVMNEEIAREDFLLSLFKPRPSAEGPYRIFLAALRKEGSVKMLAVAVSQARWVLLAVLAWWATLAVTAWSLGSRWWLVPALLIGWAALALVVAWGLTRTLRRAALAAAVGLPLAWPLLLALPAVGLRVWRDFPEAGFGFVAGGGEGALCDWLHHHIQLAAGLDADEPLTFGMLARDAGTNGEPVGIDLQMMTTNLSTARPVRLPRDLFGYSFRSAELRDALPPTVLRWLEEHGTPDGEFVQLPPPHDIPVLLTFRMSLAFPVLFTAVPLHAIARETGSYDPVAHWFSDGGISSNFPIHFFDSWMPRRPTFALTFTPFPRGHDGSQLPDVPDVGIPPEPNAAPEPRWVPIHDVGGFAGQILETMQDWRDTLQSELPGFRDRVYEARLDKAKGEGGLNLGMDADTVRRLQDRGRRVGDAMVKTFNMDQHFFTRYVVAMEQLELGLVGGDVAATGTRRAGVADAFAPRRSGFAAGDVGADELFGRDPDWLRAAGEATWDLVETARGWQEFGRFVSEEGAPRPRPVKRITPDV
jgi:predicted acylesterase/phospholipase RssA